jgi:hypothetical protein
MRIPSQPEYGQMRNGITAEPLTAAFSAITRQAKARVYKPLHILYITAEECYSSISCYD